jgi:hypothetical protein
MDVLGKHSSEEYGDVRVSPRFTSEVGETIPIARSSTPRKVEHRVKNTADRCFRAIGTFDDAIICLICQPFTDCGVASIEA